MRQWAKCIIKVQLFAFVGVEIDSVVVVFVKFQLIDLDIQFHIYQFDYDILRQDKIVTLGNFPIFKFQCKSAE